MALDEEVSEAAAALGRKRWADVPAELRSAHGRRMAMARHHPEAEAVDGAAGGVGSASGSTGPTRGSGGAA